MITEKEQLLVQQQEGLQVFQQQFQDTLIAAGVKDMEVAEELVECKSQIPEKQQKIEIGRASCRERV